MYVFIYMYICLYIYMCIHSYICMHIYIYLYTYTHIHIPTFTMYVHIFRNPSIARSILRKAPRNVWRRSKKQKMLPQPRLPEHVLLSQNTFYYSKMLQMQPEHVLFSHNTFFYSRMLLLRMPLEHV